MSDAIEYANITVPSTVYEAELALRETLLRRPLGLTLSKSDTENEDQQIHIGAFHHGELVGCVLVAPLENKTATFRIRQMAVQENHQGKGIGRELILHAEHAIKLNQGRHIVLDARVSAQGFYQSLQYQGVSDVFVNKTIPHIIMEKHF
jgi:predicted GNAT family N-acyltransferase